MIVRRVLPEIYLGALAFLISYAAQFYLHNQWYDNWMFKLAPLNGWPSDNPAFYKLRYLFTGVPVVVSGVLCGTVLGCGRLDLWRVAIRVLTGPTVLIFANILVPTIGFTRYYGLFLPSLFASCFSAVLITQSYNRLTNRSERV